jgi:hypothetical protein
MARDTEEVVNPFVLLSPPYGLGSGSKHKCSGVEEVCTKMEEVFWLSGLYKPIIENA